MCIRDRLAYLPKYLLAKLVSMTFLTVRLSHQAILLFVLNVIQGSLGTESAMLVNDVEMVDLRAMKSVMGLLAVQQNVLFFLCSHVK